MHDRPDDKKGRTIMKRATIVLIWAGLPLSAGNCAANLNWDIYSDAVINEGDVYDRVNVYDSTAGNTRLEMLGGLAGELAVHDSSTVKMGGGDINSLFMLDTSLASISGGRVGSIFAHDSSSVDVSAGHIGSLDATEYAVISFKGDATAEYLRGRSFSLVNIDGGRIERLGAWNSAIINIHGGLIVEGIGTRGFDGTINVFGYDLGKTSIGGRYGYGEVYGFFADDTAFTISLGLGIHHHVKLVPEPGSLLLVALGAPLLRRRGWGTPVGVENDEKVKTGRDLG